MAKIRSFTDYISSRFYDNFWAAISTYVDENKDNLEIYSRSVRNVDNAELDNIKVKFVNVNDQPNMRIIFDVCIEAEILISETDRHIDQEDQVAKWFLLSCSGDLSCDLADFQINKIVLYDSKNKQTKPMSDALVPIIKKEQYENVANDFLKKYYPEALVTPMDIQPTKLAEKIGLTVNVREITEDCSIFGQIYFRECETELYNGNSEKMEKVIVKEKTILVDPKTYFLRNLGAVNNTIIHECVHWELHRKAFELERLYNSNATQIKCQVIGGIKDNQCDETEWMERQANSIAPRIQMPLSMFKVKAVEFIRQYSHELGKSEIIDVMEPVINALATFFCVSRIAAKIRMIDAGYEEAIGTFTYIDGHYVKPHSFRKDTLELNQTFTISAEDAAFQRFINPELREKTDFGDYLFVDNHYVYNAPLYVAPGADGKLELTDYARSHMNECCLAFDMAITSKVESTYHTICFLNREPSDITFDITYHNGYQNAPQEHQVAMRKKQQAEWLEIRKKMTDDPEQCMDLLLEWRGMKYTDLGDKIDRDPKTISRTVRGLTEPKVETAVLICFGMNLPPVISDKLLEVLRCKLKPINPDHQWINEALHIKYPEPLWVVRDYLKQYGVEI